jgi:TPR repeat protein
VAAGQVLTPTDFAALDFDGTGLGQGSAVMLRYRVDDAWGNSKTAIVVLTATEAGAADTTAAVSAPGAGERIASLIEAPIEAGSTVIAGVGAVPLFGDLPDIPTDASRYRLRIDGFPERGELFVGERRLNRGETVEVADLSHVSYAAHSAGSGQPANIELTLLGPDDRAVKGLKAPLDVAVDQCDVLAGEPLDLQGVAPGVPPNEIRPEEARAACIKAIFGHPTVIRFYFELGRAELAARHTSRGAELIKKASDGGYIRAHTTYGMLLARGALGAADAAGANALLEKGAAAGDPYALNELGQRLYFGRDIEEDKQRGLTMLLQSAEMGHTYAINALGAIFETGNGVAADAKRALGFYTKSVARNDIYGFNNLGIFLLEGRTGPPDYAKALELFIKAHKGGHPFAATNIGRMHYLGLGVKKDIQQAVLWYGLSSARGDPYAANNLGYILLNGEAGKADPVAAAGAYAHAIALNVEGPRADAELALLKIPEQELAKAVAAALVEAGYADSKAAPDGLAGEAKKKVLADAAAAGLPPPASTTETLVTLAKLNWLRSKPRFDLF